MPQDETAGAEVSIVVGNKEVSDSNPFPVSASASVSVGTLENGAETTVSTASKVWTGAAAKMLMIQNTGATNNCRVGKSGVAATTGLQLRPGQAVVFSGPVPSNDVYAVAETGSTTVLAQVID